MNRIKASASLFACASAIVSATHSAALQFNFKEKPLTNITTPQVNAQVVSPEIYQQIGEQSRAISDDDKRFNALDIRLNGIDTSLGKLDDRIKPVEATNLKVNWIISGVKDVFGIILATGLLAWGVDALKRWRERKKETPTFVSKP